MYAAGPDPVEPAEARCSPLTRNIRRKRDDGGMIPSFTAPDMIWASASRPGRVDNAHFGAL